MMGLPTRMRLLAVAGIVGLLCVLPVQSSLQNEVSFEAPFNTVGEHSGTREVPNWLLGGDAVVLQHFVRLTPDRQSKRGHMWNSQALPAEFSASLTFRISGQGRTLFGDGLALWFTTSQWYAPGSFHGSKEQFVGIGIVFDTFRNAEVGTLHKDVSVYINDGTKEGEALTKNVQGCDSKLRYHEGRSDFSVSNASRALIEFRGKTLTISIDGRNKGEWTDCITVDNIELPEEWHQKKFAGLTATTGALADNHDVLAFKVFDNAGEAEVEKQRPPPTHAAGPAVTLEHFEHSIHALKEGLTNALNKVKKAEEAVEERVTKLESEQRADLNKRVADLETRVSEWLDTKVDSKVDKKLESKVDAKVLDQRVSAMETTIHRSIEQRLATLEEAVESKLAARLARVEAALGERVEAVVGEQVSGSQRISWLLFFFLFVFVGAGFVVVWRKYVWLKKTHII